VFILKGVKVFCFHTLLQVLILNEVRGSAYRFGLPIKEKSGRKPAALHKYVYLTDTPNKSRRKLSGALRRCAVRRHYGVLRYLRVAGERGMGRTAWQPGH
jgi:hypothetical protein